MPMPAQKPATTPIPVQLSEAEFHEFILPHLSMPSRGPKCKLGYHQVFNLILWVLYTGMQWKCLPVPIDGDGKAEIHCTTVYKVFAKWTDDGSIATCASRIPVTFEKPGLRERVFRPLCAHNGDVNRRLRAAF
jgi:transposase